MSNYCKVMLDHYNLDIQYSVTICKHGGLVTDKTETCLDILRKFKQGNKFALTVPPRLSTCFG